MPTPVAYPLSATGMNGVRLFNEQAYFRCHDAFEAVWMKTRGDERHYYQGLIQIAVAFYKIKEEKNWRGATSLLSTGIGHLKCVSPKDVELDIVRLMEESQEILDLLLAIGPEKIGEIKDTIFPPLIFIERGEEEKGGR